MRALRVALLTTTLLLTASTRPIPTTTTAESAARPAAMPQSPGPCYFINGVWVCEP